MPRDLRITVGSKTVRCGECGGSIDRKSKGRPPKYCLACRQRANVRMQQPRNAARTKPETVEAQAAEGYWTNEDGRPERPAGFAEAIIGTAEADAEQVGYGEEDNPDVGLAYWRNDAKVFTGELAGWRNETRTFAAMGADTDIDIIRRKDRSRFGGIMPPRGTTPREGNWIPADEWLATLPEDDSPETASYAALMMPGDIGGRGRIERGWMEGNWGRTHWGGCPRERKPQDGPIPPIPEALRGLVD